MLIKVCNTLVCLGLFTSLASSLLASKSAYSAAYQHMEVSQTSNPFTPRSDGSEEQDDTWVHLDETIIRRRKSDVESRKQREAEQLAAQREQEKKELLAKKQEEDRQRALFKNPSPRFQKMSDAAECAARLIEKRYSMGSIILGAIYLHQTLLAAKDEKYDEIEQIHRRCLSKSVEFKGTHQKFDVLDLIENLQFAIRASHFSHRVIARVLSTIEHPEAICLRNDISLFAGTGMGVQIGFGSAKCQTPLGRRFMLRGPLAGLNIGAGAGIFLGEKQIRVDPRSSYFYVDPVEGNGQPFAYAALGGGVRVRQEYRDGNFLTHKVTVAPTVGIGAYVGTLDPVASLCKQTRIKPNFVPLFEKFGIKIPS